MSSQPDSNPLEVEASAESGVIRCLGEYEGFTFNSTFAQRPCAATGPRFILLTGENGSGKTKLMEAIHSRHPSNTLLLGATKLADTASTSGQASGLQTDRNPYALSDDQRAGIVEPMVAGWIRDKDTSRFTALDSILECATGSSLKATGTRSEADGSRYKVLFEAKDVGEINALSHLSTGQRVLVERLSLVLQTLHIGPKPVAILIDEPELLVHPAWQRKYLDALRLTFAQQPVDIFLATHSLYILQQLSKDDVSCFQVRRSGTDISTAPIPDSNVPQELLSSANLVNYLVYDICAPELHIELFSRIEDRYVAATNPTGRVFLSDLSRWLERVGGHFPWVFQNKLNEEEHPPAARMPPDLRRESLPVAVRNFIHHPGSDQRCDFDEAWVAKSVDLMLKVLAIDLQDLPQ